MVTHCRKFEPASDGSYVLDTQTGIRYIHSQDLIADTGCENCSDKNACRILDILENRQPPKPTPRPSISEMEAQKLEEEDVYRFRKKKRK